MSAGAAMADSAEPARVPRSVRLVPSGPRAMLLVQVMQSAAGLLANGVLIAALGSASFGVFALAQAIVFYVIGVLDAAYLTPATVRASRQRPGRATRALLVQLPAYAALVALLTALALAVLPLLLPRLDVAPPARWAATWAIVAAGASLAGREFVRMLCLASRRWTALVVMEAAGNLAWLVALAAAARWVLPGAAQPAGLAVALYGLPGLFALAWLGVVRVRARRVPTTLRARALLRRGGWSFVSSQITWLQSQSYIYFVAAMLSTQALGWIAAARLLFAPLQTLSTGVMRGVLPELARTAARGESARFRARVQAIARRMAGVCAAWALLALGAAAFFSGPLHRHGYEITPGLVLAWAGVFLFMLTRSVCTQALRALECFADISRQSAFGATASLALVPLGIALAGPVGALAGLGGAEALAMVIALRTLGVRLAQRSSR